MKTQAKNQSFLLKTWFVVGVFASSALLNACAPNQEPITCDVPQISGDTIKLAKNTDTIDLSIHIDGTVSMLGYVQAGNSKYKQFLDSLDSVASSRWSKQPPKYYRFGTANNSIDRNTYRQAQLPSFYQGGAGYESSQIEKIVSKPSETGVSIIITDLYQKDADVQLVQSQLTQQYLNQGYAIGVLGLKSEFNGTIYDVGPSNQQFTYTTDGKSEAKFHPFYVLILGSQGNVSQFYERLTENGLETHQFSIFFPHSMSSVATVNVAESFETPRELKIVKALNDGKSVVRVKDNEPIQLLMATEKKDGPITFQPNIKLSTFPHSLPIDASSIDIVSSITQYKNKKSGFQPAETQAIQVSKIDIQESSLNLTGEIDTNSLDKGLYQVSVDLFAKDFQDPDWWSAWNAGSGGTDGAKTNNLQPFLRVLKGNTADMMSNRDTPIARLCYGIQLK
jgi:hypothetical protein